MIDENAFGLLISYFNLEDDEYSGERDDFIDRYAMFARLVTAQLAETPPGAAARAVDLGHAVYVEVLEDDERRSDPVAWLRTLRAALGEHDFETAGILTYGSAWLDAETPRPHEETLGDVRLTRASLPSEPLRRALLAEAATHGDEEATAHGWGKGLYLDVDAVEALGRKPKNEPTVLACASARFYRAGS
ncbi:MAG TPA: hypothetical protein VGQ57_18200 [Polyangiaceae bacterium]|jgi:hypothetical protein|nr:hypothetical protein [Polyangiaceae bacterium]